MRAHEQPRQPSPRKQLGAWYTPPELVQALVGEVLHGFMPRTALDPACGDGRFLRALPPTVAVSGLDIDPLTPYAHGNALSFDWGEQRFDAVLGNPPFLSQMAAATSRRGSSRFGGGPYANVAAEFLALAVRLTRPGGRVAFVLPQSLLAARDVAAIRAEVSARAALRWMWWSPTEMFDANVRVWAGVWEVGGRQSVVRRAYGPRFEALPDMAMPAAWSGLIAGVPVPIAATAAAGSHPTLGDIAAFTVDFRDQYYGLVGAVADDADGPPLVTCGLIEPGRCLWGERSVTFAKQRYSTPRVALAKLSPSLRRWAAARLVPKILVANQTKTIEAVHDAAGEWLPSVPVITCVTDQPQRVMGILGSVAATEWVLYHAAGSGLSAGAVRLSPSLLASIPLPG